ncbi:hypothetical protein Bca52824_078954 [Brassica carinata]|uniref:Uncharacterized protein n=1 Tax=Brassica carinata TaxID=52824 RepID=A0A8X7PYX8_BRACI|nr:hypothetical protein Bca52824_078954 [Brassica carinata]
MQLEQDPVQILDAVMPLYLNSRILRALQEMSATCSATDNALERKRNMTVTVAYKRERQARMTGELMESVAGYDGVS